MADAMELLSKLQKAHDYFGKAKSMYGHVSKVKKAADIDPHDTAALEALVGLKDKDVKKLFDTLEKRAKAAEDTAKAKYPPVECYTLGPWTRWAKALDTYGEGSKQADAARAKYLKALVEYEVELRSRMQYCDIIVKTSKKQVKVYNGLYDLWVEAERILEILIKSPDIRGTAHQTTALKLHIKFQGVGGRAKRIVKAHEKIIDAAKRHKAAVGYIHAENDVWINDLRRSALTSMVDKALKAFGVAV